MHGTLVKQCHPLYQIVQKIILKIVPGAHVHSSFVNIINILNHIYVKIKTFHHEFQHAVSRLKILVVKDLQKT